MNLDNILSWSSLFDQDNLNREVELQNPFSGSIFYNNGNKVIYVLISPWHSGSYIFTLLKRKIKRLGHGFVQYNLIPEILSPDVEATIAYFEIINQNIRKDLQKIYKETGATRFIIVGLSLSCVFASMIADNNDLITDIILVAPGNTLADSLWSGIRTAKIKKIIKKDGVTLKNLKKYWSELAPEKHIAGMKDKNVKIILSKTDKVIPYRFGRKLAEEAKKVIHKIKVVQNSGLGHYGTIIRFCFFSKEIEM
jgi:hypothetical protein